ncbi:MAG: pyruvate formate lyase family protein, partial [Desulfosudaceae bacterium]
LAGPLHQRLLRRKQKQLRQERQADYGAAATDNRPDDGSSRQQPLKSDGEADPGARYLPEPFLADYQLKDFPRLEKMLEQHFTVKPRVCVERPRLLTRWYRDNGFELDREGRPWPPVLRQAGAFKYLMTAKKPLIAPGSLLAGTTTAQLPVGVVIYPDAHGGLLWGELASVSDRALNPYDITRADARVLHHEIFPFWINRNFKEYVRRKHDYPLCMKIEERWVYYFAWKSIAISHTIPDYPAILQKGAAGLIDNIDRELAGDAAEDQEGRQTLAAMKMCLEGLIAYAEHCAEEAERRAGRSDDGNRKKELVRLAGICRRVPRHPPATLEEAVQSVWLVWVALHMENTNTGLSMGRLDQWLQPYFCRDMEKLTTVEDRQAYIKHALELIGCLFMGATDHLPLVPDIGNYLFGGSSSDQAITLGGVTPEGSDGVNDMTYIFLKITEMLAIRDPNVNARFYPGINSDNYLKRLCEVNYSTAATPSMHNDRSVMAALSQNGYAPEDIRDWSATGCVEPTLSGKHMGHTGSILMNMVSALEMALNNGRHPHMDLQLGPATGSIETFHTFGDFLRAYEAQQRFLIEQAVSLNNLLAEAHAFIRPTPLLSALMTGCLQNRRDVTRGGARYNSSGTANIGLADVVDSLLAIKKLVYEDRYLSFQDFKKAIDADFSNDPGLRQKIRRQVPLFGSGHQEAVDMARRITAFVHETCHHQTNYRGGHYTAGFWSMSQHVAYGNLSGTLPSGRIAGKAFTPGLTPHPGASPSFLDNIRDVAALNPESMDNNIAFNVKLVPEAKDSRREIVNAMHAYVRSYFDLGGMQMQFNVVNSNTLKAALVDPDSYRHLLVRISGYNAYFVTLNREMQLELIERAEYGLTPNIS